MASFAIYADTDNSSETIVDGNVYEAIIAAEKILDNGVVECVRIYNLTNSRVVWSARRAFTTECGV